MTGRERVDAAFSQDGSPEIPVVFCCSEIIVRDHWAELTDTPWWHWFETDLDMQLLLRRKAALRLGADGVDLPMVLPRNMRGRRRLKTDAAGVYQEDIATGQREYIEPPAAEIPAVEPFMHSDLMGRLPETWEDIEALIPLPEAADPELNIRAGIGDLARLILSDFGSDLYPFGYVASPILRVFGVLGIEAALALLATRPALVRHAGERLLEHALLEIKMQAQTGVMGFWVEDRLPDAVNTEAFRLLSLPLLQRLFAGIRDEQCRSVYCFCGNPYDKFDLLEAAGADALAFEKGRSNTEIEDVVEHASGRYVVFGNLDPVGVLQNGSDAQLEAELRRQLDAGRRNGRRFIMGLGGFVIPFTSVTRLRAFVDQARKFGR